MNQKRIIFPVLGSALGLLAAGLSLRYYYKQGALSFAHPMRTPRSGEIRIACVGDSITYGCGVKPWPEASYPAQLGTLLGKGYCVNNFGYSGRTAGEYGDFPYTREALFQKSLRFHPDIVIIMLGTNDTKPINWTGAEAFCDSLRRIVRAYQDQQERPAILLVTPPPAFSSAFGIDSGRLKQEIRRTVKTVAEAEHTFFLDLFPGLEGHPEWFYDGIHPNAEGAQSIAETVFHCIKEMEE